MKIRLLSKSSCYVYIICALFSINLYTFELYAFELGLPLELPIDCKPGDNCFIQNYFDREPGIAVRDYTCGFLSYNGHKGTDFRISWADMHNGAAVKAAASGRVKAIRNNMQDINVRKIGFDAIKGKEAGNGVVIEHKNGWETQYSHLKKGSIRVKPGDKVKAGQVLGLVGLSGKTEFPHLDMQVRFKGKALCPFAGLTDSAGCGIKKKSLWDPNVLKTLTYVPTGVIAKGFSSVVPDMESALKGEYISKSFSKHSPAIVFWVVVFGVQKGDEESLKIVDPDGRVFAEYRGIIEKTQAQRFRFVGKKLKGRVLVKGKYIGSYKLIRKTGEIISSQYTVKIL